MDWNARPNNWDKILTIDQRSTLGFTIEKTCTISKNGNNVKKKVEHVFLFQQIQIYSHTKRPTRDV